jgi:hypothetical protein
MMFNATFKNNSVILWWSVLLLSPHRKARSREVHSIRHYVIKFVSDLRQSVVFTGYFGFLFVIV